jgi:hypothetical protein
MLLALICLSAAVQDLNVNWVGSMPMIFSMENALQSVSGVNKNLPVWAQSWLDNFVLALNFGARAYNQTLMAECMAPTGQPTSKCLVRRRALSLKLCLLVFAPPFAGTWHSECNALSSAPCTMLATPDVTCSYLQDSAIPFPNPFFNVLKPWVSDSVASTGPFFAFDNAKYAGATVRKSSRCLLSCA